MENYDRAYRMNVFGVFWDFQLVNGNSSALVETNGTFLKGKCNHTTKTITVSKDLRQDEISRTLIHEITHLIIEQLVLGKSQFDIEDVCKFTENYHDTIENIIKEVTENLFEGWNRCL